MICNESCTETHTYEPPCSLWRPLPTSVRLDQEVVTRGRILEAIEDGRGWLGAATANGIADSVLNLLAAAGLPGDPAEPEPDAKCWCAACDTRQWPVMIVCPDCGNKRCPRATQHDNACTGSNEPGQPGSRYARAAGDPDPEQTP